jgi:hypothetical protein
VRCFVIHTVYLVLRSLRRSNRGGRNEQAIYDAKGDENFIQLCWKPEGKRSLVRPECRREDYMKRDLKEIGSGLDLND